MVTAPDYLDSIRQYMTGRGYAPMSAGEIVSDIMLHAKYGGLWPEGTQRQWLDAVALGVSQGLFVMVNGKVKLAPMPALDQQEATQLELF